MRRHRERERDRVRGARLSASGIRENTTQGVDIRREVVGQPRILPAFYSARCSAFSALGPGSWISGAMYVGVPATVIAISEFLRGFGPSYTKISSMSAKLCTMQYCTDCQGPQRSRKTEVCNLPKSTGQRNRSKLATTTVTM